MMDVILTERLVSERPRYAFFLSLFLLSTRVLSSSPIKQRQTPMLKCDDDDDDTTQIKKEKQKRKDNRKNNPK